MSAFFRRRVEETIEHMIALLDNMDGDPDLELEPVEEQHDREASDEVPPLAPLSFVLSLQALRKI